MPSEKEVMEKGIEVGEQQARLLQKIEELTCYVIEQNKKLEQQQRLLAAQEERLKALEQTTR